MSKAEKTIIAVVIAALCPASLFFLLWWLSAALSISHILPTSEGWIGAAAISGLCLGVVLDILYLKRWMSTFYRINMKFMLFGYLLWSAIAVAILMGLPFLNIVLGILAGLYVGRKQHHAQAVRDDFAKTAKKISSFTALVIGTEALFIGILALREDTVAKVLGSVTGLQQSAISGPIGMGLVIVMCLVLMVVQYCCTRTAARFAFGLGAPAPGSAMEKS